MFLYYLLDHVDGELSRYYSKIEPDMKKGLDGQYFDVLCHSFSGNIIIFFFGISAWKIYGYEWAILLAFFVSVGMNRFPERVANKIMIQTIVNHPNILNQQSAKHVLNLLEMKKKQVAAVRAPITDPEKWRKLFCEMLGFPGLLILIIIVAGLDAFFSDFILFTLPMNFRLLLVIFLLPIEFLRLVINSYKYFYFFKTVIIDS